MAMQFSEEDREKLRNDQSEIYKKRTDKTMQKEIANLSRQGKWQHFKDYYLKGTIALALVIVLVICGIVQAFSKKASCALYVAIQHDAIPEEQIPFFEEAIEKYLGLDSEDEFVTVDISGTDQQLQTYFYAGVADILITDEESFKKWGRAEYFYAFDTNEEVEFYQDYDEKYRYYTQYITGEDVLNNKTKAPKETEASDKTEHNCGLYLTDSDKYHQIGGSIAKPVLGVATTTKHLPEAKAFIKYMMDNGQEMTLD